MKALFLTTLLSLFACHSWAEEPQKGGLLGQAIGYWMVDFDSEATKTLIKTLSEQGDEPLNRKELEELLEEIADRNFEISRTNLKVHTIDNTDESRLEIKAEDIPNKRIEGRLIEEDSEPSPMKIAIHNRGITLSVQENIGEDPMDIGLTRLDKKTFIRRMSKLEELRQAKRKLAMLDAPDQYPVATRVPDKDGFVISPYNNKVIDVRGIPSGTLVQDPTPLPGAKNYFRLP